jgi:hypothetical protein
MSEHRASHADRLAGRWTSRINSLALALGRDFRDLPQTMVRSVTFPCSVITAPRVLAGPENVNLF